MKSRYRIDAPLVFFTGAVKEEKRWHLKEFKAYSAVLDTAGNIVAGFPITSPTSERAFIALDLSELPSAQAAVVHIWGKYSDGFRRLAELTLGEFTKDNFRHMQQALDEVYLNGERI